MFCGILLKSGGEKVILLLILFMLIIVNIGNLKKSIIIKKRIKRKVI